MKTRVDNLEKDVIKLRKEYSELDAEFSNLLSSTSSKSRPRIIGVLTAAGAITEKLLILIIKDQKKDAQLQSLEAKQRGLFKYREILQDIIPKQQDIHINTINQWRNLVAHANDIEKVDAHELRGVNAALKSFFEWFFTTYLQSRRPDLNNVEYNNTVDSSRPSQAELDEIKKNFEKNPLNIPDYSILAKSKKIKKKRSVLVVLFLILIVAAGCYFIYDNYFAQSNKKTVSKRVVKPMDKEEMFVFLNNYFNSLNEKKADPHVFFADKIDNFYTETGITPYRVEIIRQISDFIDNKHSIDKESLYEYAKRNGNTYWRFWNDFQCYRPSLKKYESCKVLMEFGFNESQKICSILEIKKLGLKFWTKPKKH